MAKKPELTAEKDPPDTSEKADLGASNNSAVKKMMKDATGSDFESLQTRLLDHVLASVWVRKGKDQNDAIMATIAAIAAIKPTDGLEGMLAAQMVATHETVMECLRCAMSPEQSFEGRDSNLKHAPKLLQIYTRQMEVLAKHRIRGQQKITVEHVNVHAGGQAIVGNVDGSAPSPSKAASA
ncbi:hypothetical protein [Sphingorhabdus sp. YGSMI21]|uniref:hypothetical protein n=1 Tax=Sphingorhabdus sp. YGSMI21 TaxID=2077182 RepID=UPI000C1EBC34|nr:hypothetical protein [Sphingorhabdus sp. YGSMI21]ATW03132.1 hypothetical protein CHN51_05925 [Sphingorhabdus sp. YGSMI21]